MQINSISGMVTSAPTRLDEGAQKASVPAQHSPSDTAPVTPVARDAVQAMDPKEQARQVDDAVKRINETIKSFNKDVGLEFSTDEDTKIRMVKLVDVQSKEVLRQIPSEEVLNIAKAIDKLQGLLVRDSA